MTDGEIRERRVVLRRGIVMLYGAGFWHPCLAAHAGEVVEVMAPERGGDRVLVQVGSYQLFASPIPDLVERKGSLPGRC
jgi:hypothetical protein